eukprot:15451352-Alexandrium_andersonii.AAC.1
MGTIPSTSCSFLRQPEGQPTPCTDASGVRRRRQLGRGSGAGKPDERAAGVRGAASAGNCRKILGI